MSGDVSVAKGRISVSSKTETDWKPGPQLLKYAAAFKVCRSLFQGRWEMGISVYSLCIEPWDDSQLCTVSLFVSTPLNTSPACPQSSLRMFSLWQPPKPVSQMHIQAPFLETLSAWGRVEEEYKSGTHQPPQSLERSVIIP